MNRVVLRVRRVVGVAVLLLVLPRAAAADDVWGSVRLPGGGAAMRRVAGLGAGPRLNVTLLTDYARALFTISSKPLSLARENAVKYLEYVIATERALADWPDGFTLLPAMVEDRDQREKFERLAERLGLRYRVNRDRASIELGQDDTDLERHAWLLAMRVDVRLLADGLNKGERVRIVIPGDDLPLPLPALWSSVAFKNAPDPLIPLMSSPEALFTYLGLMELDRATLEWIASRPDVFRMIYEDRSIAFGAFGRGVRIRDGGLATPGGASAVPIWEDLVDAPVKDPLKFLSNLLERDNGRLAYFYTTAAEASTAGQAFLLGDRIVDARGGQQRLRYVRAVRDAFVSSNQTWDSILQPLLRPALDPPLVMSFAEISDDATAGPDWWPSLLDRIVSDDAWPARPQDTTKRLKPQPATASWLFHFLFEKPDSALERWTLFRFAQRRLRSADRSAAHDVEVTLRALKDMPALVLALERMGVTDPSLFALVARAARRLSMSGGPEDVNAAMRGWQGALATLEQSARHRPIPPALLTTLLTSLARAVTERPLVPSGHVASWMLRDYFPAIGATDTTSENTEAEAFRRALSERGQIPTFEWEGLRYRLNIGGSAAVSAAALRAAMPGPRLQHLAALDQSARTLAKPLTSLDELAAVIKTLEPVSAVWTFEALADALKALRKIRVVKDLRKALGERTRILVAIEAATSEILPGLAYALALSPTIEPARLFADGPGAHVLAARTETGRWESFAWRLGGMAQRTGQGAAIEGSLLGLDLARAIDQLASLPGRPTPIGEPGSAIRDNTERRLADRAVLRTPLDWTTQGRDVAAAIARGRARLAAWKTAPPDPAALTAELGRAGIGEARQNQLQWQLEKRDMDGAEAFLTVGDFYRLGSMDNLPAGWGQSGREVDGCWCVLGVSREPVERFRGYLSGHVASMVPDLSLRLAEILSEMHVSTAVLEPMLPFAIRDVLDGAAQFLPDDWVPLTWVNRLTPVRVEDYLQALVARRILAAPDGTGPVAGDIR